LNKVENMSGDPRYITVNVQGNGAGNSGLGTAGLIFSILGWFTCGLLCPLGAFLSFLGLFSRGSKSNAVAGLIVGFPGVFFLVFVGFSIIAGMLGIGATASAIAMKKNESKSVQSTVVQPSEPIIENAITETPTEENKPVSPAITDEPPTIVEPPIETPTIDEAPPKPTFELREWSNASGSRKIIAKYNSHNDKTVNLTYEDGTIKDVEIAKLSTADQEWIKSVGK
jgi:hypothetical protein